MIDSEFVQIAFEAPIQRALTYRLPKDLSKEAIEGSRVKVPLGKRFSKGVLIGKSSPSDDFEISKIKNIDSLIDEPPLGEKTFRWLKWLSQYYLHPPGQVFSLAFAPGVELRKRKSKKSSPTAYQN